MSDAEGPTVGRRRLVLVSQQEVAYTVRDFLSVISGKSHAPLEVESDFESLPALNPDNTDNEPSLVEEVMPRAALQGLDDVDLEAEFCTRACDEISTCVFSRRHYRSAMRFALTESDRARDGNDPVGATRAWKLFLLFPCLLLHRPARGGNIPKCRLKDRFSAFCSWPMGRFAPPVQNSVQFRLAVQLGELSSGRHALEGASLVPGTITLTELQDPNKRPPVPVEYKFIQNHFHPNTTSIPIPVSSQNQFHPKTTFIPKRFHPKPISSPKRFL